MITVRDIKKAIVDLIHGETGVNVYAPEVEEGHENPCYRVKVLSRKTIRQSLFWEEKRIDIEIQYYPKEDTREELLTALAALDNVFDINIKVLDRYLELYEKGMEEIDELLYYTFYLEYTEEKPQKGDENDKYMEELSLSMKGEK